MTSTAIAFAIAFSIRIFLIHFGDIFTPLGVNYTDIDYYVFTDAARHIYSGGSAFDRDTYRYTPLLAYILQPNIWFDWNFGKYLFSIFDILGGYLIYHLLNSKFKCLHYSNSKLNIYSLEWVSIIWLFNPIIFAVSSRGSCDSIIVFIVLLTVYFIVNQNYAIAGIIYGVAIHFRIYPIIYCLIFVLYIGHQSLHLQVISKSSQNNINNSNEISLFRVILNAICMHQVWYFIICCILMFSMLTFVCYLKLGGDVYIQEAWLYHLTRIDAKHNFSVYFLFIT